MAASLAAGPAVMVGIFVSAALDSISNNEPPGILSFGSLFAGLLVSVPMGALLACIPCAVATLVLARLATPLEALRLPAAWGVTGGLIGYLAAAAFAEDGSSPDGLLSFAGAACALSARMRLHWE